MLQEKDTRDKYNSRIELHLGKERENPSQTNIAAAMKKSSDDTTTVKAPATEGWFKMNKEVINLLVK